MKVTISGERWELEAMAGDVGPLNDEDLCDWVARQEQDYLADVDISDAEVVVTLANPAKERTFREYKPTQDWAGLGYNHWMVATEFANGTPVSGCGATRIEAYTAVVAELVRGGE